MKNQSIIRIQKDEIINDLKELLWMSQWIIYDDKKKVKKSKKQIKKMIKLLEKGEYDKVFKDGYEDFITIRE